MGKYKRNKAMMQRMYGADALHEAFAGIMPQPIQVYNYIQTWLPEAAGFVDVEDLKAFKRWCRSNEISKLHWHEVTNSNTSVVHYTHKIALKNNEDWLLAVLKWK